MSSDLILVHSGSYFPNHINDCISLAEKQNFRIHLILEKQFHHLILSKNVLLIDLDTVTDFRYQKYNLNNYDVNFRDGFFPRTSSRFILIDNYAKNTKLNSFFHIENDIAIFSNLEHVAYILKQSTYDTAIVMDNPLRCVPSIIWYRNDIASDRMSNFICNHNTLDDMRNLAVYFHNNRQTVTNLPIVPFDLVNNQYNINFGNMYKSLETIFDGAAIGQYLYGIDTLGNSPTSNTIGFINETCVFDVSKFHIELQNNRPIIHYNNTLIPINNLHIHSKNFKNIL